MADSGAVQGELSRTRSKAYLVDERFASSSHEVTHRSSVHEMRLRPMHPNAAMVIRAIAKDDVVAFCRELVNVSPSAEHLALKQLPVSTGGYTHDATAEEEQCTGRYCLKDNGSDAAHVAASNDAFSVLNFILRMQTVDLRNSRTVDTKWTPLHFAAFNQHERMCSLLRSNGADLMAEDAYGEKPMDIARTMGNRILAERLGDTAEESEEETKKSQAYQLLLAQARAFEEERARELQERARQEEERQEIIKQQEELAQGRRRLKVRYECQRLDYMRERWLPSRQSVMREYIVDQLHMFWTFVEHFMGLNAARASAAAASRIAAEERARALEEAKKKKKKKGNASGTGGKRSSAAATTNRSGSPSTTAASSPLPGDADLGPGVVVMANADVSDQQLDPYQMACVQIDAELPFPEVNDRMSKEEKKEIAKVKAKVIKERKLRRDALLTHLQKLREVHQDEQDALEMQCIQEREDVSRQWLCGLAMIGQTDPGMDRKHAGLFRYEPFEERFRWSCCGQLQDPLAVGCQAGVDSSRPFAHTGVYSFHIPECGCGGKIGTGANGAQGAVDMQRANIRDLASNKRVAAAAAVARKSDFGSVGGVDALLAGGNLSHPSERNQRRVGPTQATYCAPGACCWSCCGATVQKSPGCTPQNRFLYGQHLLCDVRFSPADGRRSCSSQRNLLNTSSITVGDIVVVSEASLALSASDRPTSPKEQLISQLEQRSVDLASTLLQEGKRQEDVDESHLHFVVGSNGSLGLDADTDNTDVECGNGGLAQQEVAAYRSRYSHALHPPSQLPYCVLKDGTLRVSHGGRRIEHLVAPVVDRRSLVQLGFGVPRTSMPVTAQCSRVNVLGNVVMRPVFLADARREAAEAFISNDDLDGEGASLMANSSFFGPHVTSREDRPHSDRTTDYIEVIPEFASDGLESEHVGERCAYAFEIRITSCPLPHSVTDERLVVGIVSTDIDPNEVPSDSDDEEWDEDRDGSRRLLDVADTLQRKRSSRRKKKRRALQRADVGLGEDDASLNGSISFEFSNYSDDAQLSDVQAPDSKEGDPEETTQSEGGDDDEASLLSPSSYSTLPDAQALKSLATETARAGRSKQSRRQSSAVKFDDSNDARAHRQAAAAPPSIFSVPSIVRKYFSTPGTYISGPHGIGWWSYSSSIRGMGNQVDTGVELREGDIVLFLIDGVNDALHVFHNRSYTCSIKIDTSVGYVPAMTLTAGCRVDVEYFGCRSLQYVDRWWADKVASERMLRMTTTSQHIQAKLDAAAEAKRVASSRSLRSGPSSGNASQGGSMIKKKSQRTMVPDLLLDEASTIRY